MKAIGAAIGWFISIFVIARLFGYSPGDAAGCGGIGAGVSFIVVILATVLLEWVRSRKIKRNLKKFMEDV